MTASIATLVLTLAAMLAGCRSVGPGTVAVDRIDYSRAVGDSWKRQTLLNIIKLRYMDPPVFVDVGSIVSGYSMETGVSVSGTALLHTNGDAVSLQGSGKFTDRPTITYIPLTGNRFLAGLMMPIPPESLLFTIQSGWPADAILRLGATSINGLRNEDARVNNQRAADDKFVRAIELMRSIQMAGAMSIRVVPGKAGERGTLLVLRRQNVTGPVAADVAELTELLGLDPEASEYRVGYGSMNADRKEIAILSRSLLHMIGAMALRAELPAGDVEQGRAAPAPSAPSSAPGAPGAGAARRPFIRCTRNKPPATAAFASVPYRGHWFWIDDRDLLAKRDFAFVMLLFTLADTGAERSAPVITIPAQ